MQTTSFPMDYSQLDDALLVRDAARNKEAFTALYRLYVMPVYRYLYHRLGNFKDAEDITAQVLIEALEGIDDLDGCDRKLEADMGHWMTINPTWSPDGKWLMTGVLNTDLPEPQPVLALINVQDCRIIPLAWSGDISTWIP